MTPKQIDAFCRTLPAATRTVQWEGVIVFKVGGKMFCLIAPPDHSVGRVCFKCPPEQQHKLHLFLDYAGVEAGGEVPDPYYGNLAGFERVLTLCEAGARGVLDRVAPSAR